jgi:hypothetical protein
VALFRPTHPPCTDRRTNTRPGTNIPQQTFSFFAE